MRVRIACQPGSEVAREEARRIVRLKLGPNAGAVRDAHLRIAHEARDRVQCRLVLTGDSGELATAEEWADDAPLAIQRATERALRLLVLRLERERRTA